MEFTHSEVPLWHFAMMNDDVRNTAYDQALGSAIKAGKRSVLDIGTGSGLLALMAARHGASKVVTCEGVSIIARKAKRIIDQNGYADHIQVIEGLSTNLKLGPEPSERFDVLVTEIFDDGLLGEGAFKSMKHAKQHLLKPGAQIIPSRCRVMAMGIESKEIYRMYRVNETAGFNVSEFNEFSVHEYVGIHLDKMAYRPLTKPKLAFTFDFNNLPEGQEALPLSLDISEAGILHAIAYWFELDLDDQTTVSSGPGLAKLSSWKQAIQLADGLDTYQVGETVSLNANHDETSIWFSRR